MGEDGYGTTFVELIKRTGSHLGVSVVKVMMVIVVVNFEKFSSDQLIVLNLRQRLKIFVFSVEYFVSQQVIVTGGKDTGLKPRVADLVPGSWAQRR